MYKFKVNDRIIIKAEIEGDEISGIHNYESKNAMVYNFSKIIDFTRFFASELEGKIYLVGKNNMYVIYCLGNYYIFSNDYNEMRLAE